MHPENCSLPKSPPLEIDRFSHAAFLLRLSTGLMNVKSLRLCWFLSPLKVMVSKYQLPLQSVLMHISATVARSCVTLAAIMMGRGDQPNNIIVLREENIWSDYSNRSLYLYSAVCSWLQSVSWKTMLVISTGPHTEQRKSSEFSTNLLMHLAILRSESVIALSTLEWYRIETLRPYVLRVTMCTTNP